MLKQPCVPDDSCNVPFPPRPRAVIPLPAQGLKSYTGPAHDWKDLVKVGPDMTKAILAGKIYKSIKSNKQTQKNNNKKSSSLKMGFQLWGVSTAGAMCQEAVKLSRMLREAGRQNFSHELTSSSPYTAVPVWLPSRGMALRQQAAIWPPLHIPPLPHSTSALTGPALPVLSSTSVCFTTAPVTKIYKGPVPTESSALPAPPAVYLPSTVPNVESSLLNAMEETVTIKAWTVNLKKVFKYLRSKGKYRFNVRRLKGQPCLGLMALTFAARLVCWERQRTGGLN